MKRLYDGVSLFCSSLAITLLVVALMAAPINGARADDPGSGGVVAPAPVGNCADGTCIACDFPCSDVCTGVDGCGPDSCNCTTNGTGGCTCTKK